MKKKLQAPEGGIKQLEKALSEMSSPEEAAKVSFQLAELLVDKQPQRAFHYAKLAGEGFVKASKITAAMVVVTWLRDFSNGLEELEELERMLIFSFCRRPKKRRHQDEHLPKPLPFMELNASVSSESFGWSEMSSRVQLSEIPHRIIPLFSELKASEAARFLRTARLQRLKNRQKLFEQGERSAGFFIVAEGYLHLESSEGFSRKVESGEIFGDVSFFGDLPHSSTATAVEDTELLFFPRAELNELFETVPRLKEEVMDFYYRRLFNNTRKHSLIFSELHSDLVHRAWEFFVPIHVPADRILMEPNQRSDRFFLILKGQIQVRRYDERDIVLGPGHFIGERGVILETMRTATLVSLSDCELLECDRWSFEELCEEFPDIQNKLIEKREELQHHQFVSKNLVVD